jgi:hypothetical protein
MQVGDLHPRDDVQKRCHSEDEGQSHLALTTKIHFYTNCRDRRVVPPRDDLVIASEM